MTADGKTQIAAAIDRFIRAYRRADLTGVLAVFASDYVDMGEGERTLRGQEAIDDTASRLRDTFEKFHPDLEVDTEEIRVEGNMAYDMGTLKVTLTPKEGGAPLIVERRFLEIWSRQPDGSWKVCRGMDNIDRRGTESLQLDFRVPSK